MGGGIPDLHFEFLALNVDGFHSEVDGDGGEVVESEVVAGEALDYAGLADAAFADHEHFDLVVVVLVAGFFGFGRTVHLLIWFGFIVAVRLKTSIK